MRLTLLALIGVLCLAYSQALPLEDNEQPSEQIGLLDIDADEGEAHANEGNREARQYGWGGWGGGGWGGGGWGYPGWGGGWGGGGWGRRGWGGGWGHHRHHWGGWGGW